MVWSPTPATQMPTIQKLMGALCFARRAARGRPSPYTPLLAEDLWGNLGESAPAACALCAALCCAVLCSFSLVLLAENLQGSLRAGLLPVCIHACMFPLLAQG